jgi:hypothetical protein
MAQTRRKRKSKHRGTAGGTVTARGRTGRKLTEDEKKAATRKTGGGSTASSDRRAPRHEKPPTWKGSLQRAAIVTVVFVGILVALHSKIAGIIAILPFVLIIYTAIGYYTDRWMHLRWLNKQGR